MIPKVVITDIDGVWTDGGMYYDQKDNEWKKFHTYDSAGIIYCRMLDIPVIIMTGENTSIVARRAQKLRIEHVYQGIDNKLKTAKEIIKKFNCSLKEVAYIGDDINDLPLLKSVGISGCPANANTYVKKEVDIVTQLKGGEGAFREFIEKVLIRAGIFEELIDRWLTEKYQFRLQTD